MVDVFLPTLLAHETSPLRFESVCIDLYHEAEGIQLVPTSRTHDLGRDARSISVSRNSAALNPILLASVSGSLDRKIEDDIRRLSNTTRAEAIVYCTPQPLTESTCDAIEARIRNLYGPARSVRVVGQTQLSELVQRHPQVIHKHYAAEIENLRNALLEGAAPDAEPDKIGLRLALLTQTGDDASALRAELAERLLLDTLRALGPLSRGDLAVRASSRLHLPRALSPGYVVQNLQTPLQSGRVIEANGQYELTEIGRNHLDHIPAEAGVRLLEGRQVVRNAIRELSGHSLTDHQYGQLWDVLQDGLSQLFYRHGASIVMMIALITEGQSAEPQPGGTKDALDALARKVTPLFSSPDQAEDVRVAIVDMFSEPNSEAFRWLSQTCCIYVMMCSLGFESLSAQQIQKVLRDLWLVPDTDVVISLLCVGEPNHDAVKRIVGTWRRLGGKLLAAPPVMEEVAYHAWISERDFEFLCHGRV